MPAADDPVGLDSLDRVRSAAPEICRSAGIAYPPELLEVGLPPARRTVRGSIDPSSLDPDRLVASWITGHPDRKGWGVYMTPGTIARDLLALASRGRFRPPSVLDPAVGAGIFLLEAWDRFGPDTALWGVDRDPTAVALTRLLLWTHAARWGRPFGDPDPLIERIRWGDSILDDHLWKPESIGRGFDLVCGNPPFGNGIEARTRESDERRDLIRGLYPEIARGPYDRSVPFVHLAGRLLAPGGRFALLVPSALLAARYATGLRGWLARAAPLTDLLLPPATGPIPGAAISLVGWVGARSDPSPTVRLAPAFPSRPARVSRAVLRAATWGGALHPLAERLERSASGHATLGSVFHIRAAASVGEAYRLVAEVVEGGDGYRFLTAGLVRRYSDQWGQVLARHLGRRFERPILPRRARALGAGRAALYRSPKIIVSGLSRWFRARGDLRGECAGAIGTFLLIPRGEGDEAKRILKRGVLLLNSVWLSQIHRSRAGPLCLAGGNLPLGRADLEAMPFPSLLALPGRARRAARGEWSPNGRPEIPDEIDLLLGMLDAAYERLTRSWDPDCDRFVQLALLRKVAGLSEMESLDLLNRHGVLGPS